MANDNKPVDPARRAQLERELHRDVALRRQGYRDQALKILPHICASCGREFTGPRLRELTVHHRDHDFRNNPADGSNWELLCLYCHDNEHRRLTDHLAADGQSVGGQTKGPATHNPFEALKDLLKGGS